VFEAVSRLHAREGRQANLAVVSVPDERVERLASVFSSQRKVHAQVRLRDVPGFDARALHDARECDALAIVLRCFGPEQGPVADLGSFRAELAVADVSTIEQALERFRKKAKSGEREAQVEVEACEKAEEVLGQDRWLVEADWAPEHERVIRLLTPLTFKPVLHVLNLDETAASPADVPEPRLEIRGLLEAEAAELDEVDASALLAEYGVAESATQRFVHAVYGVLDLVTFFTANEVEARAWDVRRATTAPRAAGSIHTDFERGFIRAEVIGVDELAEAGSWDAARQRGLLRVEGKGYEVADGDVLSIRHS